MCKGMYVYLFIRVYGCIFVCGYLYIYVYVSLYLCVPHVYIRTLNGNEVA